MNTETLNNIFTKEGRCSMLEMILNEIAETTLEYEKVEFKGMLGKVTFEVNTALNTIEAKEVDLDDYYHKFLEKEWFGKHCNRTISEMMAFTAKHFFELGISTQQNISVDVTNIDKIIEENGVDPNSKEAKIFKESYYMALEKLKAQKGE